MSNKERILITLVKAGNSYAFERLYYSYNKKLYNFAFNITKNKEDAEGLVQDVFMKIWETRSEINPELSFGGYIFRIAKNMLYNQIKKEVNKKIYAQYLLKCPEDVVVPVEQEINYLELNQEIERLITTLPEKRRTVFLLSRNAGLTYREIAEKLNISVNTVNTQISKSLEQIRDHLVNKFYPEKRQSD
jgi:RNA polymerase sigma-70 factor (ECF subfamily)